MSMLLEQTPKEFRIRFLLKLTRELIENTKTYQELRIKEEVKKVMKRGEEKQEFITSIQKEKIRIEKRRISEMEHKGLSMQMEPLSATVQKPVRQVLVRKNHPIPQIPEP